MTTKDPEAQALQPTPAPIHMRAIRPSEFKLAETVNHRWRAIVSPGMQRERLCDSDLWSIVSSDMLAWDRIDVVAEDRSFFAELLVLEAGRGYANVIELGYKALPPIITNQDGLPPGHEITHGGPESLYVVRRLRDGVILGKGFPSRDEAVKFLLDHASLRS